MPNVRRLALAVLTLTLGALPASGRAAPPPGRPPVKLGALLAVTGGASFLGAPEERSLRLAVERANAAGGLGGAPIELIVKDTGGDAAKAVSMARQLIDEEHVFAIIGPSTSGETMNVKKVADEGKTLLLSCAAAETIVLPVSPWVFKTPQNDSHAVQKIFERIKAAGLTRVGVLSSNTGFGKAGKAQLEKLAPQFGLTVVASEVYAKDATALGAEVTKIKESGAQALVNWSIEPAQALVLKDARQLGLNIPIYQSHGFGNLAYVRTAGAAAEGVVFPAGRLLVAEALPDSHPQKKMLLEYKRLYEDRYKEEVSTFGGHSWDAFLLLEAGVKVGGLDAEKVRAAIENVKGLVGTAGVYDMTPADHGGLPITAFEMLTVKDGRFVLLAR
jgi:branched-chain amino acid transport system substrate-binding protein